MCSSVSYVLQHVIPCHHRKHFEENLLVIIHTQRDCSGHWCGCHTKKQSTIHKSNTAAGINSSFQGVEGHEGWEQTNIRNYSQCCSAAENWNIPVDIGTGIILAQTLTQQRYTVVMLNHENDQKVVCKQAVIVQLETPIATSVQSCSTEIQFEQTVRYQVVANDTG